MSIYSSGSSLENIKLILAKYLRLPFSDDTIPGNIMEAALSHVRGGEVLNTYDFVDVIKQSEKCGWQVKSTKEKTPVTWKRAKIPEADELIKASKESDDGLQTLGDSILEFCNDHAEESMEIYNLDEIGYARLIVHDDMRVTYFEKKLCNKENPEIFKLNDFIWKWSTPKKTKKKEQLPALHGIHKESGRKWWAWHGLGENQLHFSGENVWWPTDGKNENSFTFQIPTGKDKLSLEGFLEMLAKHDLSTL